MECLSQGGTWRVTRWWGGGVSLPRGEQLSPVVDVMSMMALSNLKALFRREGDRERGGKDII